MTTNRPTEASLEQYSSSAAMFIFSMISCAAFPYRSVNLTTHLMESMESLVASARKRDLESRGLSNRCERYLSSYLIPVNDVKFLKSRAGSVPVGVLKTRKSPC